jgi:hypothetical protein
MVQQRARTGVSRHFPVTSTLRGTAPEEDEAGERRGRPSEKVVCGCVDSSQQLEKTFDKKEPLKLEPC